VLAERTGITTVNNFRERDVVAGGQGAPLTGYADWLLLRHATDWRAIQNIGGMGNVTFLPPLSDPHNEPIAFDTGPGNALIDAVISEWKQGTYTYDPNGDIARAGQVDDALLQALMAHPYIQRGLPKTTGRETFGTDYARQLYAQADSERAKQNLLTTLTMFTAMTIADSYQRFAPAPIRDVILGGGGRHNVTLVSMLQGLLGDVPVRTHEDIGLDSDFKEALVFAILAYETWHGRVGALPSQTGATKGTVLGQIIPSYNYANLIRQTWVE
jgi:anhydro-N-acetylmuramic acid kinase